MFGLTMESSRLGESMRSGLTEDDPKVSEVSRCVEMMK